MNDMSCEKEAFSFWSIINSSAKRFSFGFGTKLVIKLMNVLGFWLNENSIVLGRVIFVGFSLKVEIIEENRLFSVDIS